jgi:hypothetical protein
MKATNGHAALTPGKLAKFLADREADVAAIRRTLELMTGAMVAKKRERPDILADALAIDATRRAKRKYTKRKTRGRAFTKQVRQVGSRAATLAARRRTAKFLAKVARSNGPYTGADRSHFSALVLHGYIKKQGEGYVRTEKPYDV